MNAMHGVQPWMHLIYPVLVRCGGATCNCYVLHCIFTPTQTDVQSMVGGSVQTVLDKGKSTRVRQMLVLVASISQPLADGDAFVIVKVCVDRD